MLWGKNNTLASKKKLIHILICSEMTAMGALRTIWWPFQFWKYRSNSFTYIVVQILNRISMLLVYLFQSLYVQSWLLIIVILNNQKGEKGIKITFFTIDSICVLLMLITVIFRIFVKDPDSTDPNKTAYAAFNELGI